ncbi:MAG TPA: Flp family type IVb pilin [Bryobacteraceae bacterium]|jgi:Flp pilus assembly pilin Flp
MRFVRKFWKEQEGQDLIEYSLLLGFMGLFAVGVYTTVSGNISTIWGNAGSTLSAAAGSGS